VRPDSDPLTAGDEPVLIARRTNRPVAVSGDRYMAAKQLLEHTDCDVLICDDGLQHLSLERDLEIALVDGDRRFGNRHCLPAGPLREPVSRLTGVDMVVSRDMACKNEFLMKYAYGNLISIKDNREMAIEDLNDKSVHVVTGIANPLRFYAYLKRHNIRIIKHEYPDHHRFSHKELQFDDEFPVVMTEKDAVKCKGITGDNLWYLPVTATFDEVFHHRINSLLKDMFDG
jgi:tetraacyldisaccharide 4'-kinase